MRLTDPTGMYLDDWSDDGGDGDGGGGGGGGDDGGVDYGSGGGGDDGGGGSADSGGDNGGDSGDPGGADPSDPSNPPDSGCTPGDFSCNPFSDNSCLDPWAGSCGSASGAAQSIAAGNGADSDGDPCVYTNSDGTYSVDTNSSPKECAQTQGNWVPPGYQFAVDSNGNVSEGVFFPQLHSPSACGGMSIGLGLGALYTV
ncbi:MAG: hypothetical protein WAM05_12175, partial [Candidatus Binataceae bacterium]